MHQNTVVLLLGLALVSCGGAGGDAISEAPNKSSGSSENSGLIPTSAEKSLVSLDTEPFAETHLCKATIHAVIGANPKIMRTSEQFGSTIVAYNRESDGKFWDYMCRLDGDRMVWGSNGGRWHNHNMDEYIRVSVESETSTLKLHMIHSDNSSERYEFKLSELE